MQHLWCCGEGCNFLGSVSSQQKFEEMGQHYSLRTDRVTALKQISVTALFYSEKRKIYPQDVRAYLTKRCKEERERERDPGPLAPLFICLFLLLLGLPYVNWASQECFLFYLRSSLWSSDFPLFYFRRLFPSLCFSHRHCGLLFPILTT